MLCRRDRLVNKGNTLKSSRSPISRAMTTLDTKVPKNLGKRQLTKKSDNLDIRGAFDCVDGSVLGRSRIVEKFMRHPVVLSYT